MSSASIKIAGVVLAGGQSSRMGFPKEKLKRKGVTLLQQTHSLLHELGLDPVVISGPQGVPDFRPNRGPVEAIRSVGTHLFGVEAMLVVPVDMPLLTPDILLKLIACYQECRSAAVCFAESWLPALFRLDENLFLQCLEHQSVHRLFHSLGGKSIEAPPGHVLSNVNTPNQLSTFQLKTQ